MDYIKILEKMSIGTGVSGYEKNLSNIIEKSFKEKCDEVLIDKFYNVIGIKKGNSNSKKKILITAHYDEIGFLVKSIDENGFIKVTNIGGIDNKILLAQEVNVHGKRDMIGIIGAKPPHLLTQTESSKAVKLEDIYIDVGMNCEEVKKYVSIGDMVTFRVKPFILKGEKLSSKSLDNRAGVGTLLFIMDIMVNIKHEADIYFVATTQEEVGLRGAKVTSYNIEPDIAIVLDACHGDMPDAAKDETYALGKGPAIAIGPNLHRKLTKKIINIAKEENIPYQIDVEPGDTGTEAWAIQVSKTGVPTALISIPLRYMHTTIETISTLDVKNSAKLVSKISAMQISELEEILCC